MTKLTFGSAIDAIKAGHKIARTGWNGKGMFVYRVPAASYPAQTGVAKEYFGENAMVPYNAYMAIKNVDGTVSTWVPSVNDCLAEDWVIVGGVAASSNPPAFCDEEHVAVPRGLIGAACYAIEHKREGTNTLTELRRYTFGDKSKAISPAAPIALPVGDPGPDSLEREIQAKADKAPRVTPADIEADICAEYSFTLDKALAGCPLVDGLDRVTVAVIVLRNGAKLVGVNYGAIDPANHRVDMGVKEARAAAVEQAWPLLGFRLRDELARPVLTEADAAADLAGTPRPDNPSA